MTHHRRPNFSLRIRRNSTPFHRNCRRLRKSHHRSRHRRTRRLRRYLRNHRRRCTIFVSYAASCGGEYEEPSCRRLIWQVAAQGRLWGGPGRIASSGDGEWILRCLGSVTWRMTLHRQLERCPFWEEGLVCLEEGFGELGILFYCFPFSQRRRGKICGVGRGKEKKRAKLECDFDAPVRQGQKYVLGRNATCVLRIVILAGCARACHVCFAGLRLGW